MPAIAAPEFLPESIQQLGRKAAPFQHRGQVQYTRCARVSWVVKLGFPLWLVKQPPYETLISGGVLVR